MWGILWNIYLLMDSVRNCIAISFSYWGFYSQFPQTTSASVKRANSALRFANVYRSKMSKDQLNSLILMYVHKDIKLDYNEIIDMYARSNLRRMLFINPLGHKYLVIVTCFVVSAISRLMILVIDLLVVLQEPATEVFTTC